MDTPTAIIVAAVVTVVTALGTGFARLVRWAFVQWRAERAAERDERKVERTEQRAERREERAEDRAVLRENTSAVTELATHLKSMRDDFEEITGVHNIPAAAPAKKKRLRTLPLGVAATGGRKDDD